ncbi:MAG: T9SS type A sorting domain-containing protein [Balneola sp.]
MKRFLIVLSFFLFQYSDSEIYAFQDTTSIDLQTHVLVETGATMAKLIPYDINNDGFKDLIYQQVLINNSTSERSVTINYVAGTANGFDKEQPVELISNKNILTFFLQDWNNNGKPDLILRKQRTNSNGENFADLVQINYMNDVKIDSSFSFQVPKEVYLGNETNYKEIQEFKDFNLDGLIDMVFIGFSHVTIGWNNGGNTPEFSEITNFGFNTYTTKIFDYNQDGYPDFINDDQYWKEPVIHLNNKDKTFTRTSLKLPKWSFNNESSLYWGFEVLWLNEDPFPDLLTQKTSAGLESAVYKLYTFNFAKLGYKETSLSFNSDNLGILEPIHFNNDGFTDFVEIKKNKFRIWINSQNQTFSSFDININTGHTLENFFKMDSDKDGDLDIFFSFQQQDTLYHINNTANLINEAPAATSFKKIEAKNDGIEITWEKSTDKESLAGHLKYELQLVSEDRSFKIDLHSDSIKIGSLPSGDYTLTVQAIDPLNSTSALSETGTLTIISTSAESEDLPLRTELQQNYPNPFNPTTTIQFELVKATSTKLTVYDVLGRKVRELVNEIRPAGTNTIQFDAANLASGIYLYRLEANGVVQTKRLTLIK